MASTCPWDTPAPVATLPMGCPVPLAHETPQPQPWCGVPSCPWEGEQREGEGEQDGWEGLEQHHPFGDELWKSLAPFGEELG